nr:unnamed protein product [Callosobruchus chinensis]
MVIQYPKSSGGGKTVRLSTLKDKKKLQPTPKRGSP